MRKPTLKFWTPHYLSGKDHDNLEGKLAESDFDNDFYKPLGEKHLIKPDSQSPDDFENMCREFCSHPEIHLGNIKYWVLRSKVTYFPGLDKERAFHLFNYQLALTREDNHPDNRPILYSPNLSLRREIHYRCVALGFQFKHEDHKQHSKIKVEYKNYDVQTWQELTDHNVDSILDQLDTYFINRPVYKKPNGWYCPRDKSYIVSKIKLKGILTTLSQQKTFNEEER